MSPLPNIELIEQLERDYSPQPIPPCRICGAPLSIGQIGGGEPTIYYCSAMADAPRNGLEKDWEHYGQSKLRDLSRRGDQRVIQLTRRLRSLAAENDSLRKALVGIVGTDEPSQLRGIKVVLQVQVEPCDVNAALITAIDALLAAEGEQP